MQMPPPRKEQTRHHKWISHAQHKKELRSRKLVECAAKIVRPVRHLSIKCKEEISFKISCLVETVSSALSKHFA